MRRHSRAWHAMHDDALALLMGPAALVLSPEDRAAIQREMDAGRCGTLMPMVEPGAPPQAELDLGADRRSRRAERNQHFWRTGDLDD